MDFFCKTLQFTLLSNLAGHVHLAVMDILVVLLHVGSGSMMKGLSEKSSQLTVVSSSYAPAKSLLYRNIRHCHTQWRLNISKKHCKPQRLPYEQKWETASDLKWKKRQNLIQKCRFQSTRCAPDSYIWRITNMWWVIKCSCRQSGGRWPVTLPSAILVANITKNRQFSWKEC